MALFNRAAGSRLGAFTASVRSLTKDEIADAKKWNAEFKTTVVGGGGSGGNRGDANADRMISIDAQGNYKLNFMLGVGGQRLPILPKGTKVGDLVMGDWGLYRPANKEHQDYLLSQAHLDVYKQGKIDTVLWPISQAIFVFCVLMSAYNLHFLVTSKDPLNVYGSKK